MAVIDVSGITKRYGPSDAAPVLTHVDLRVEAGAIVGLLGPNGAGKTTLIKVLAGLLHPDSGSGTVLGHDILRQPARIRASVSLVAPTADVGLDNNLTVRQNLAFWAPVYGLYGGEAQARIEELLLRLDLQGKADAWPMHISAGQRQRLALARSLLAQTPLLFLDEPTNKLDPDGIRSVRQIIRELNTQHGVTIVLTTHVMEEAEELCSEIVLLDRGHVLRHQPTRELMRSGAISRTLTLTLHPEGSVFTPPPATEVEAAERVQAEEDQDSGLVTLTIWSSDLDATTPALLAWVFGQGHRIRGIVCERISLDDVFRRVMRESGEPR